MYPGSQIGINEGFIPEKSDKHLAVCAGVVGGVHPGWEAKFLWRFVKDGSKGYLVFNKWYQNYRLLNGWGANQAPNVFKGRIYDDQYLHVEVVGKNRVRITNYSGEHRLAMHSGGYRGTCKWTTNSQNDDQIWELVAE